MWKFIAIVAILAVISAGMIYAAGWMTVRSGDQSATIEIKTGEMKQAGEKAVEKGRELIDQARQAAEPKESPPAGPRDNAASKHSEQPRD